MKHEGESFQDEVSLRETVTLSRTIEPKLNNKKASISMFKHIFALLVHFCVKNTHKCVHSKRWIKATGFIVKIAASQRWDDMNFNY